MNDPNVSGRKYCQAGCRQLYNLYCSLVVPHAAREAERLLETLLFFYEETDGPDFRPNDRTGSAVIAAWVLTSDEPQAMKHGTQVLAKMKVFAEPDLVSYNTLLAGMGRRGHGEDALQLLDWLDRRRPELQPNRISFNSTLNALAKDKTYG